MHARVRVHVDLTSVAVFALIVVAVCRCTAHADPAPDMSNVHLNSASSCTTAGGSSITLPPGFFLDEIKHAALDAELRRLQDAETRLSAENVSFRAQAPGWQPGWKTILTTVIVSMAVVLAIEHEL